MAAWVLCASLHRLVLLKRLRNAGIHSGWHILLCVRARSCISLKRRGNLIISSYPVMSTWAAPLYLPQRQPVLHPRSTLHLTRKHYAETYYLCISYDSSEAYKRRRASQFVSRWLQSGEFVSHPKPNSCISPDATLSCVRVFKIIAKHTFDMTNLSSVSSKKPVRMNASGPTADVIDEAVRNELFSFCYLRLWGLFFSPPFETLWRMLTSADKVTVWDLSGGEAELQVALQDRAWASPVSHTHPLICLNSPGDK